MINENFGVDIGFDHGVNERLIDDLNNDGTNYLKYCKAFTLCIVSFASIILVIISLYHSVTKLSPQYSSLFLTSLATFALYLAKTLIMGVWNYFIIRNFFTKVTINKDLPNSSIMIPWILTKIVHKNPINDKKCNIYNLEKEHFILKYFPNKGWYTYEHIYNGKKYKLYINYKLGDILNSTSETNIIRSDEIIIYLMDLDTNIITDFIKKCYESYYQKSNNISIWNYEDEWIEGKSLNNLSIRDYQFSHDIYDKTRKKIDLYLGFKDMNWRSHHISNNNMTDSMIDHYGIKGFTLIGPSGTGKTKFIEKIAYELNINIGLLDLTNPNINNNDIINAFKNVPINTFFLLENIDLMNDKLNLSCIYSLISGFNKKRGVIIFATAVNIDGIDKRLFQPNRLGDIIRFNYTNNVDRCNIFRYWYEFIDDNIISELNNIITNIESNNKIGISHAMIQNFCKESKGLGILDYNLKNNLKNYILDNSV